MHVQNATCKRTKGTYTKKNAFVFTFFNVTFYARI